MNQLDAPSTPPLNRSLSAPSKLDQSTTVQEGIHDVRRLQRWRTNVQKKHSRCSTEDQTDSDVNVRTFVSTVAEIFTFIGSDPDKAVSIEDPERDTITADHRNLYFLISTLYCQMPPNIQIQWNLYLTKTSI